MFYFVRHIDIRAHLSFYYRTHQYHVQPRFNEKSVRNEQKKTVRDILRPRESRKSL